LFFELPLVRGKDRGEGILDYRVTAFLAIMVYDVVNTATQSPQQGEAQMASDFKELLSYSNKNALAIVPSKTNKHRV
jgi:hypothetical protein